MWATKLADQGADRFAHGGRNEVELTGLGRSPKLPVLPCRLIAGFQLSTEAIDALLRLYRTLAKGNEDRGLTDRWLMSAGQIISCRLREHRCSSWGRVGSILRRRE